MDERLHYSKRTIIPEIGRPPTHNNHIVCCVSSRRINAVEGGRIVVLIVGVLGDRAWSKEKLN